ncbi:hypothetical protein EGI20_18395 [Aquitalea sp. S1-19]|nr:hypothetical protein [Aquitalea sp. S1-19]
MPGLRRKSRRLRWRAKIGACIRSRQAGETWQRLHFLIGSIWHQTRQIQIGHIRLPRGGWRCCGQRQCRIWSVEGKVEVFQQTIDRGRWRGVIKPVIGRHQFGKKCLVFFCLMRRPCTQLKIDGRQRLEQGITRRNIQHRGQRLR